MFLRALWVLPLTALFLGCTPKIGNNCTLSTDCSQLGDRLCDTNQPDGYCTVFNCEPDTCPDSVCVAFDPTLDPACGHSTDGRWPRFERTFCLAPCNSDSDCRDQYQCVDLSPLGVPCDGGAGLCPNPYIASRAAIVVDTGALDGGLGTKVCMVRSDVSGPATTDAGVPPVCVAPDAGLADGGAPWPAYDGGP